MPSSVAERQDEGRDATLETHVEERARVTATGRAAADAGDGAKKKQKEEKHTPLRYQKRSLLLLAVYIPFLITRFVDVTSSIAALLTVPITSALLAHGAVVYCQRTGVKRELNLRKTFVLADRGWADLTILLRALKLEVPDIDPAGEIYFGKDVTSRYLWMAAFLLLISAIQGPLSQALVGTETINVMTCDDVPTLYFTECSTYHTRWGKVAKDPEPYGLGRVSQGDVVPVVVKNLATVSLYDSQALLWHDRSDGTTPSSLSTLSSYYAPDIGSSSPGKYFISAVPYGTSTGVLRVHAMRLHSSVNCQEISRDAFPTTCVGSLPLTASYIRSGQFEMEVCVPGNQITSPWTLTRDRQDITEDMYIKTTIPGTSDMNYGGMAPWFQPSSTVRCTVNTTRGYFELGNERNDHTYGPLLEKWPDEEDMKENFNDYLTDIGDAAAGIPSTINSYPRDGGLGPAPPVDALNQPYESRKFSTPGPLMTTALALFGKDSMFNATANVSDQNYPQISTQICQAGNIPFQRLSDRDNEDYFQWMLSPCNVNDGTMDLKGATDFEWTLYFIASMFNPSNINNVAYTLPIALYLSTEAWLLQGTANAVHLWQYARDIYSSPGMPINRPVKTVAATIGISVLLLFQLAGLLTLVYYIYSAPTWTIALDSFAIAQLTKDVDREAIPTIGERRDKNDLLGKTDGLVGMVSSKISAEDGPVDSSVATHQFQLARGGQGVISKGLLRRRRSVQETLLEK